MSKENSLKKMKRKDLLEILLLQYKKIEELQEELKEAKEKLNERQIILSEVGSIAEASLKLNKVFEVAQRAADDYIESIKKLDINSTQKQKEEYNKRALIKKEIIDSRE